MAIIIEPKIGPDPKIENTLKHHCFDNDGPQTSVLLETSNYCRGSCRTGDSTKKLEKLHPMCSRGHKFVLQITVVLRCILCMLLATSSRGIATVRSKIFHKGFVTQAKLYMSSVGKEVNIGEPLAVHVTSATAVSSNRDIVISGLCDFDCNILHKDLAKDKTRLLTAASSHGINFCLAPGTDILSSQEILDLTTDENETQVFGSAGVHPYNAATETHCDDAVYQLAGLLSRSNCYAVGECGLDYSNGFPDKALQIVWFRSVILLVILITRTALGSGPTM